MSFIVSQKYIYLQTYAYYNRYFACYGLIRKEFNSGKSHELDFFFYISFWCLQKLRHWRKARASFRTLTRVSLKRMLLKYQMNPKNVVRKVFLYFQLQWFLRGSDYTRVFKKRIYLPQKLPRCYETSVIIAKIDHKTETYPEFTWETTLFLTYVKITRFTIVWKSPG